MSNNNIRQPKVFTWCEDLWIFLYWIWLFPVFLESQEKRTVFCNSFQAENSFSQVIFKPEVCKGFVTLFHCMSTSPVPISVWYLQWRVQPSPRVFYSDFNLNFSMQCFVLFLQGTVIFYSDVAWEPSFQSPGGSGTPISSVFLCFL